MGESQQYLFLCSNPFAFLPLPAKVHSNLGPDLSDILSHGPPTTQGGSSSHWTVCSGGCGESQDKKSLETKGEMRRNYFRAEKQERL